MMLTERPPTRRPLIQRLALAGCLAIGLLAGGGAAADTEVPGEIAVKLRSTGALPALLLRHQLSLMSQFGARPIYRLKVTGAASVRDKLAALALEPEVLLAEANTLHAAPEARRSIAWAIGTPEQFAAQWALPAINLREAQALSVGAGVRVATLDSGVDFTHPSLQGRLLPGWDFVDNDPDPSEPVVPGSPVLGHGTHVAGLIAVVAPGAWIRPYRVLDAQGEGNEWVLAEALLRAVDPDGNPATRDGAQVINLSLGTTQRMRLVEAVAMLASCAAPDPADPVLDFSDPGYNGDHERCAQGGGAVIVSAAGNDGSSGVRQYPAAARVYGQIAVGATRADGRLAGFSNTGSWVDLAAPGEQVTSLAPGGGYATWSGTSMSAPLVAGAAALLRALSPTMEPVEVVKRLRRSATQLCDGKIGQLDAWRALAGQDGARRACR